MARDRPRLAVGAVLAATRPEEQQRGERAGRADQVDGRRAGEVLHADVGLQPAAAEHPARGDRIDEAGEDHGVGRVHAELDPLERRAPHDGQRDGAEDELEEPLRLDGRVRQPHDRERLLRVAEVLQEPAGVTDQVARAESEGETVIAATLVRWLGVSAPAVTMAIRRLKRDNLIRVSAAGGISLTRNGREIANWRELVSNLGNLFFSFFNNSWSEKRSFSDF